MMAAHIPGPWEASTGENDGRDFITIEHEGMPICEVRGTDDMSCIEEEDEPKIAAEMVATAYLICAAPDLLEALIKANNFIKHMVGPLPASSELAKTLNAGIEDMQKAINKALNL